ncbi:WXG100 family type VII secretion target [Paractinoplanes durhamensis]|uniref:ESAT-6-like protein n=1 Tax=Paractinoplanes durhamensis TaxID=113563 RepID=A0ABQ3Z300_9ACTN|nr:WXG100 family type VII secretion target [Actinoplanes durhamensis]GIE04180.1 hypothetical protein Adu01nite_55300 [Actinoplanes durhamensis]
MAQLNRVDDTSLHPLVGQLEDAHTQLTNVHSNVSASQANLQAGWQGEASLKHGAATNQWLDGLAKVQEGVRDLHGIMSTHANVSARAEGDIAAQSSSWT